MLSEREVLENEFPPRAQPRQECGDRRPEEPKQGGEVECRPCDKWSTILGATPYLASDRLCLDVEQLARTSDRLAIADGKLKERVVPLGDGSSVTIQAWRQSTGIEGVRALPLIPLHPR